jgi:branched-chain amino acid transport system ATP-binding protein
VLEVEDLVATYGPVCAVDGVSLSVPAGSITAVLGANGAGKSSLLRAVSGIVRPRSGRVRFCDEDITAAKAEDIVRRGLAHVPEGGGVIAELSVEENLRLGCLFRRDRRDRPKVLREVFDLFPRLEEHRRLQASSLSGGERQMLSIGRALMGRPRMLLLDEPSLGLAPQIVDGIFDTITRLNSEQKLTVLLVEQNAQLALSVASYGYIMENGRVVLDGPSARLQANPDVQEFYLGFGEAGERKSMRDVKHYKRRKRWLS